MDSLIIYIPLVIGVPTSGPMSAHTGDQAAAAVLDGNYAEPVDSRLVSPTFVVPSASENPRVGLWHWFSFSSLDNGEVQIRVEDEDWQTIGGPFTNTGSGQWTFFSASLSAYSGSIVQIAFDFQA